jgi:hypothetical protein
LVQHLFSILLSELLCEFSYIIVLNTCMQTLNKSFVLFFKIYCLRFKSLLRCCNSRLQRVYFWHWGFNYVVWLRIVHSSLRRVLAYPLKRAVLILRFYIYIFSLFTELTFFYHWFSVEDTRFGSISQHLIESLGFFLADGG